jgi:hypothetical protein
MMQIEFKARMSDLKNAARQLLVNPDPNKATDFADVLVSECIATLRTVGTSIELPVHGIQRGTARLPLVILQKFAKVAHTFKVNETRVLIWDGLIKIGGWQTRSAEITLGTIPDQSFDIPGEAHFLDTLAAATLLTTEELKVQGLERRVAIAERAKEDAIDRATRAMEPLMVEREKIAALVHEHIAHAGERLQRVLRT